MSKDMISLQSCKHFEWRWFCEESKGRFFVRQCDLDLTGSGNETSAHLAENGRITFLFCAFRGTPQILRLYGKGVTVLPGVQRWDELVANFSSYPGIRQIILASIDLVRTSCGYGVPLMELQRDRETLARWSTSKGEEGLADYRGANNRTSLDGLPTPLAQHYEE